MTYREKIQELVARIDSIYDECEGLRDMATDEEKSAWNDTRRIFYNAAKPLRKLDNQLTQSRATMLID